MKNVINVDSNSKSEEHRCEECNSVCQNCNTAPEPPQDTSLDYKEHWVISHFTSNGVEAKTYYEEPLSKLLQVIEDEVIHSPRPKDSNIYSSRKLRETNGFDATNDLISKQRQVLKQIKDNVINGGSL